MRLLKIGCFGSDFRVGAPRRYKHLEIGIFMVKVWSLLNSHTCSVLLKSFSGQAVEAAYPSKMTKVDPHALRVKRIFWGEV